MREHTHRLLTIYNPHGEHGKVSIQVNESKPFSIRVHDGLPVKNSCIDEIRCDVDLHYLPLATTVGLLRDCRRVLTHGGGLVATSSNLDKFVQDYASSIAQILEVHSDGGQRSLTPTGTLRHHLDESTSCAMGATEFSRLAGLVGLQVDSIRRHEKVLVANLSKPKRSYARDATPLVSILIAAYRPDFLDETLRSARVQTWKNLEIIVGDDCPNDQVGDIVRRHMEDDPRIRYDKHGEPLQGRGRGNYVHLFESSSGDLIKYLNDDDLIDATCVERMARCLMKYEGSTLVTSHRRLIDSSGQILPDIPPTRRPVRFDTIINGASAINNMIKTRSNWIGEPTTVMFRRADIRPDEPDLLSFAGLKASANGDTTLWAHLLSQGDLIYLIDSLSSFRQHDGQGQRAANFLERANRAWDLLKSDTVAMGLTSQPNTQLHGRPLQTRPWWNCDAITAITEADSFIDEGDLISAASALVKAIQTEPEDAVIRHYSAQVKSAIGDKGGALLDLLTATTISPHYAPAQEELALFHQRQGDNNAARHALEQVLLHYS